LLDTLSGLSSSTTSAEQDRVYKTMLIRAADTSQHQLSGSYTVVSLDMLACGVSGGLMNQKLVQNSVQVRGWDPAIPLLQHRLCEYKLNQAVDKRKYNRTQLPLLGFDRVRVHRSGVLAADCPWEQDSLLLQTIRATPSFYGKPWFSSVAVLESTGSSSTKVAYAKLLLLFEAQLEPGRWQQLAYVQWYKAVKEPSHLTKHGAVALAVETGYDPAQKVQAPRCGVIPLSSILRTELVVPNYGHPGQFHASPFKH
jgi:hypothetical protein